MGIYSYIKIIVKLANPKKGLLIVREQKETGIAEEVLMEGYFDDNRHYLGSIP